MDVISVISKRLEFEDADDVSFGEMIRRYYANGPRIHEFLKEMNQEVLSHYDCMTVGEGPGIDLDHAPLFVDEERKELHMIFHFDHMFIDNGPGGKYDPIPYDVSRFKKVFKEWDDRLKDQGWGSIFLGNHDFARIVSRFGNDGPYHSESAKLLSMLLLSLRGTPYIYQGDEIGMTNVQFPSIDYYQDVETLGAWREAEKAGKDLKQFLKNVHWQSRDNARTPMQWTSGWQGGFSETQPWLRVNPNYTKINVEDQQTREDSILNFYRQMIFYRKTNKTLVYGDFVIHEQTCPDVFAYERRDNEGRFSVWLNMSDFEEHVAGMPEHLPEIHNYQDSINEVLRPWEGRIYRLEP
jgi:oligo-1,6-glucosidase